MPVLALAGHDDTKYSSIAIRIADQVGENGSYRLIDGAGHSPHLEQPDEVIGEIRSWLAGNGEPGGSGNEEQPDRAERAEDELDA